MAVGSAYLQTGHRSKTRKSDSKHSGHSDDLFGFVKYVDGSFFIRVHNPVPLLCLEPSCLTPPKTSVIQIKARIAEGPDHGLKFN